MPQNSEAEAFLQRVSSLPNVSGVSLDQVLKPSLEDEAELRRLFATDKSNPRISDPYVGLVDVFDMPLEAKQTRARVAKDDEDLNAHYVMPLSSEQRREEGAPSMVSDFEDFKKNWAIFSEGSLSQLLDWNNVVVAGGSVLACLTPIPESAKVSKRAIRKYVHSTAFPSSDIDVFLYGLTPEQAEVRIQKIYEAVRDSIPWDVTCVRTKHTVSIHSQYPYRSVQIVLRLYSSPAEILAGFDIDAPCCLYDGQRVWANPRAIVAIMRQCNTVDMTRRSPSYEVRLAKYSSRGYEIFVPNLRRNNIDPTIYERSIVGIEGLARLLVLEKLMNRDARFKFMISRRELRGRPGRPDYLVPPREYKNDLKDDHSIVGLELSNYDVASLHIPYGPGWDARRIEKLVYQTDLGMNTTFNPKNKGRRLHRHPAFFGTMEECMEDCCEYCPDPETPEDKELQEKEDAHYIRGRVSFIQEDPGRQSISGSFNPIDVGEWSTQAYIGEIQMFFAAISSNDRVRVSRFIQDEIDINRRDHVGRTPLHFAIVCKSVDVALDLIDAGARMTARLVDGRTSLHLAAQLGQIQIVRKLLERSTKNAEDAKQRSDEADEKGEAEGEKETGGDMESIEGGDDAKDKEDAENDAGAEGRESSEDDWSSEKSDKPGKMEPETQTNDIGGNSGDIPEDETDAPDVFDVNIPDWDLAFTPLAHAVARGHLQVVEELLAAGSNAKLVTRAKTYGSSALDPLTLATLAEAEDQASKVAEKLILAGATSSIQDDHGRTTFYRTVMAGNSKMARTILQSDRNAKLVLNFPVIDYRWVVHPIVLSLNDLDYSTLAVLLAHNVKLVFAEEDVSRAMRLSSHKTYFDLDSLLKGVHMPLEAAIAGHDDIFPLLIELGAEYNISIQEGNQSILDWVRRALAFLSSRISRLEAQMPTPALTNWNDFFADLCHRISQAILRENGSLLRDMAETKKFLEEVEHNLVLRDAKTWNDIRSSADAEVEAENSTTGMLATHLASVPPSSPASPHVGYCFHGNNQYNVEMVPKHLRDSYDELFEACYRGDNEKIQQLCLPEKRSASQECLQISVQTMNPFHDRTLTDWTEADYGYTPLFAAVRGRHWETVQLVVAIAAAQYSPEEPDERFNFKGIKLDDSDSDSRDSDVSMDHQAVELDLNDIANRSSSVRCPVSPLRMISGVIAKWVSKEDKIENGNLIKQAIFNNDFEAFVNIADLYERLPKSEELSRNDLTHIMAKDRVEMLDEFIRRTGFGLDSQINVLSAADGQVEDYQADEAKIYLGLTVHGEKRKDLARKKDRRANHDPFNIPILWMAASAGAENILEYLCGDRPLAAYKFYITTNRNEKTRTLQRIPDLAKVLTELLGWTVNSLNESPLLAAALGNNVPVLEKMFYHSPQFMKRVLHERVKFAGYTALMIAADNKCGTNVIDFLIAKGLSPADVDSLRGWNLLHFLCFRGYTACSHVNPKED